MTSILAMGQKTSLEVPPAGELLVARTVFRHLGISDALGYRLIGQGRFPLPVKKLGGQWVVTSAALRVYLDLDPDDLPAGT